MRLASAGPAEVERLDVVHDDVSKNAALRVRTQGSRVVRIVGGMIPAFGQIMVFRSNCAHTRACILRFSSLINAKVMELHACLDHLFHVHEVDDERALEGLPLVDEETERHFNPNPQL